MNGKINLFCWKFINYFYIRFAREKYGLKRKKRNTKIIISLTSFPQRFPTLHLCLSSLFKQICKPDEIILYVDDDVKEDDITVEIQKYVEYGLQIKKRKEDIKPHKKYLYAMKEHPNDIIITVDDDMIYDSDLVYSLVKSYKKYPSCVSAKRVHKITFDEKGKIKPYSEWESCCKTELEPQNILLATGVGGVLYPPKCLYKDAFDIERIIRLCRNQDDIWLKLMEYLNGTKVVFAPSLKITSNFIEMKEYTGLRFENVENGANGNDICIQRLLNEYTNELKTIKREKFE